MKLNYKRTLLVGMAFFLITAFWQAYDAIVPLILTNHFGLPQTASGAIMSVDNVLAVFLLPLFGAISDKTNTRHGKRTPFILFGTVAATLSFIALSLIDNYQLARIVAKDVPAFAENAKNDEAVRELTMRLTLENPWPLIGFVATLLVVLIAMAIFRSPAVALMPDVTVKPLRSKGNAIINLTGTAGGILVLVLGMVFSTSKNHYMRYTGYVVAVAAIMLLALTVFLLTVKEKQWAKEMQEESVALGLEEQTDDSPVPTQKRRLSRSERISLLLILASVALWYIGYNSITSKYSVYATNILGFDFNLTLIIAQAAAVVTYVPVGILSSRFGRKKTILAGVLILATAFFIGNFVTAKTPEYVMYPVFILAGIGWATINVNSFPMVVELASGGNIGKYTGYYYTASMAAQIVAPILSGLLYDLISFRYVFFAFGTVFVLLSFVTMLFVKHGDVKPIGKKSVSEQMNVED
ncbi:MAG: MFS transporter [Clostridia bacterium]|nr:MFS transporter [Clostridia bacterium]MBQ9774289.1 MFS transporter [Clostridia bacterium]